MIRKTIVIAFALIALWATPAVAQYAPGGAVEGAGANQGGTSGGGTASAGTGTGTGDGSLARTGSDATTLLPYALVLIAGGAVVLVVARRRSGPTIA